MKQVSDAGRLQFSKIPIHSGKVLEERKSGGENELSIKPSYSSKRMTFGARLTTLSNSGLSMVSSTSSLGYGHLTSSRLSIDSQSVGISQNRASFKDLRLEAIRNRENEPPGLTLLRKVQSIKSEDCDTERWPEKVQAKPILKQSIIINRLNTELNTDERVLFEQKLEDKDMEIVSLKQQILKLRSEHQQQIQWRNQKQNVLQHSIQQLNLIVFQLRNTKEYQGQIIRVLEERSSAITFQRNSLAAQNQNLSRQIEQLRVLNQKIQLFTQKSSAQPSNLQMLPKQSVQPIQYRGQVSQLQKTIAHQTTLIKTLRSDLKKSQQRAGQLQSLIEQSNLDILSWQLSSLNQSKLMRECLSEVE